MTTLSDEDIRSYIATGEPMDKAGAYAIQGMASRWIPRIEGDYFNVVGLPVALVYRMLKEHGWTEGDMTELPRSAGMLGLLVRILSPSFTADLKFLMPSPRPLPRSASLLGPKIRSAMAKISEFPATPVFQACESSLAGLPSAR